MSRLFSRDLGMLLVLAILCAGLSLLTLATQDPPPEEAARQIAERVQGEQLLLLVRNVPEDRAFADRLVQALPQVKVDLVIGGPQEARKALVRWEKSPDPKLDAVAVSPEAGRWLLLADMRTDFPGLGAVPILKPVGSTWPSFLQTKNLLNIADQVAVIAIVAVGMTFVIISGGIDLSSGSLIALAAVTTTLLIRDVFGAQDASTLAMVGASLAGILLCGLCGLISGWFITGWNVPSFIVTLSMMLVARGLAENLADNQSIYQVPDAFTWLGRGKELFGLPNGVVLMALLYLAAHLLMGRTVLGRHLYAVGSNRQAALYSGIAVRKVTLFAYAASGLLAGLGGVLMASNLRSGAATYGQMYELYAIAAVVVGGASLSGGEGKILGTLLGVFVIAVLQNGMNLMGIQGKTQQIVLGLVILFAVLLDQRTRRKR